MKRDCRCDLCREGVPQEVEAVRAWCEAHGGADGPKHLGEIRMHLERFVGGYDFAFSSRIPGEVPIDVLLTRAVPSRPWHLLVTAGLSDLPMRPPPRTGTDLSWAELAICLPREWRFTRYALSKEEFFWPIRLLLDLARYPHRTDVWLWQCHTIGGVPDEPLAASVPFTGALLQRPVLLPEEFGRIDGGGGKEIRVFCLYPLHQDEIEFGRGCCEKHSVFPKLLDAGVTEVVDPARPSVLVGEGRM